MSALTRNWTRSYGNLLGLILPVLLSVACSFSIDPGTGGPSAEDLGATQVSLQATQMALDVQQQQQQDQQQQQQQQQQPPAQDQQQTQPQDQQQPPQQDQQSPQDQPSAPDVSFQGVSFSYDKTIAGGVTPSNVSEDHSDMMPTPHHMLFSFTNYINVDSYHNPVILIYKVSDYSAVDSYAGQVATDLQGYLASKNVNIPPNQSMPFLPIWNAGSMITTNVQYLDFQNGSCVRYLTQHGQAAYPINNQMLFYTAQCLTSDQQYYAAAILPVTHPVLPANGDQVPGGDWAAFSDNFAGHVTTVHQQLNAEPGSNFTPSLDLLDALMRSLRVEPQPVG